MMYKDVYQLTQGQEALFAQHIDVNGWQWNFEEHRKTAFFYKHGRLLQGNDDDTPVKNITRRLLQFQYHAENVNVTDIVLYVNDPQYYWLSFLLKKYHEDVFVVENNLDNFFDELNESKVDYGIGIAKKRKDVRPEVVDVHTIAFGDQTDFTKGPFGIKHNFTPEELMEMKKKGWGDSANNATITVEDLIAVSEQWKDSNEDENRNQTPGNYVEVYEVHGVMPKSFLDQEASDLEFERQIHIIAFYKGKDNMRHGVTLFAKKEAETPFKLLLRDRVSSRCAGWGGAEELVEPQVWANNDVIRLQEQLDANAKTILKYVGNGTLKTRFPNGLKGMDTLDIVDLDDGEDLGVLNTQSGAFPLFMNSLNMWENHAREVANATAPLLGEPAPSGTPFSAQERQVIQGKGPHEYRVDKYARMIEEMYRDWFIPHMAKDLSSGTTFMSELSTDEMSFVADAVVRQRTKKALTDKIFNLEPVTQQDKELIETAERQKLAERGSRFFLEIVKDEVKDKALTVKVNVKNRQKDLERATSGLVNVFRQIIANPQGFEQAMQNKDLARAFNQILEFSNISPVHFAGTQKVTPAQPQASGVQPEIKAEALATN